MVDGFDGTELSCLSPRAVGPRRASRNEIADGRQDRRRSATLGLMASVSRPAAAIGYVASGHEPPPDFEWDRAIAEIVAHAACAPGVHAVRCWHSVSTR